MRLQQDINLIWHVGQLHQQKEGKKDQAVIRRFLFVPEDKEDQYKEFGWTELHCIDGERENELEYRMDLKTEIIFSSGCFYFCQTEPFCFAKTKYLFVVMFNGKKKNFIPEPEFSGIFFYI